MVSRSGSVTEYSKTSGPSNELPRSDGLGDVQLAFWLLLGLLVWFLARSLREENAGAQQTGQRAGVPAPAPYRVDLNAAPAAELRAIPGVGEVLAQRIADERRRAPFAAAADLARVHGIGPVLIERIRPHVVVRPTAPRR